MSPAPADVDAEFWRIGHVLRPLDIVLVNTSAGAKYVGARRCDHRIVKGARGDLALRLSFPEGSSAPNVWKGFP
jgi:hypothetical protein